MHVRCALGLTCSPVVVKNMAVEHAAILIPIGETLNSSPHLHVHFFCEFLLKLGMELEPSFSLGHGLGHVDIPLHCRVSFCHGRAVPNVDSCLLSFFRCLYLFIVFKFMFN